MGAKWELKWFKNDAKNRSSKCLDFCLSSFGAPGRSWLPLSSPLRLALLDPPTRQKLLAKAKSDLKPSDMKIEDLKKRMYEDL